MEIHKEAHPLAGRTVVLNSQDPVRGMVTEGQHYWVEDWWDRVSGGSWMYADGNPACIQYAVRTGTLKTIPTDDEVVYGKIDGIGHLVHVSELGEVVR